MIDSAQPPKCQGCGEHVLSHTIRVSLSAFLTLRARFPFYSSRPDALYVVTSGSVELGFLLFCFSEVKLCHGNDSRSKNYTYIVLEFFFFCCFFFKNNNE